MKSCIILCGGQSRRMGQDKGSMIIQDKPMIKYILSTLNNEMDEVIIVLNDSERIDKYKKFIDSEDYSYELKFRHDRIKNKGPLPGILVGLENISSQYAIIFPCDNPFITKNNIHSLFKEITPDIQAVVPYHDNKNKLKTSEPLYAIYNKNIIPIINDSLLNDSLHIKGVIEKIETKFVLIDNKKILKKEFRNLNRPEDLKIFN